MRTLIPASNFIRVLKGLNMVIRQKNLMPSILLEAQKKISGLGLK